MKTQVRFLLVLSLFLAAMLPLQLLADGPHFGPWGPAEPDIDTDNSVAGGCPHESRDGRTMYMALNRDGGHGDLDIWVAHRSNVESPFGEAENLEAPVNSSNRPSWGDGEAALGGQDVYSSTREDTGAPWSEPDQPGLGHQYRG